MYQQFSVGRQTIRLWRADSHDLNTVQMVRDELSGEKLDFLFIDADHSYEGVKMDFEVYSPLVRAGGLIAMHDIVEPVPPNEFGVHQLWAEIKPHFRTQEIISDPAQTRMGIGLIWV